jgi:hypothetical protein
MRFCTFVIAVCAGVLFGPMSVPAKTILQPPSPAARFFLSVPSEKFGDLRRILMDFAAREHLSQFKDVKAPRAQGKQFFLLLYSDKFSFVIEKSPRSRTFMIECLDLDSEYSRAQAQLLKVPYDTESPFGRIVARLKQRLKTVSPDISDER